MLAATVRAGRAVGAERLVRTTVLGAVGLLLLVAVTFPEEAIVPVALLDALVPAARESITLPS